MPPKPLPFFTTAFFLLLHSSLFTPSSSLDFIFNADFNSTNILTLGNATVRPSPPSILSLTEATPFSLGRAFYPSPLPTTTITTQPNASLPFHTSFIFSIVPPTRPLLPGHGFAFLFSPSAGIRSAISSQHLGLFNLTNDGSPSNRVLAVEFDVFMNQEFNDLNDNHVGVDVNSLTSIAQREAGFWRGDGGFEELMLNSAENYQVWIDYVDSRINVTMARAGEVRPRRALISEVLNLSGVFSGEMFVGFAAATGQLVESHNILAWSFSNSNASIGDALITSNLPSFVRPDQRSVFRSVGFIVGTTVVAFGIVGGILVFLILIRERRGKNKKKEEQEEMEDWETEYWPHRIDYRVIYEATDGFNEENVIGCGGNGKVYKGKLDGGTEVAVKKISLQNQYGLREFLAELSSLGRLKHRNLVSIRGWCKKEQGSLILVYDYMENGSLDQKIFHSNKDSQSVLTWEQRMKILRDAASGILYLHEGWEVKVLHRDIKASNVLLDKEMNARLGDFGLAKMHSHGQLATTTQVVGTVGYMAPEMMTTGRATTQTDVFGFGVLILEVVCGRRPVEEGKPSLVDEVRKVVMEGRNVVSVVDGRVRESSRFGDEEVKRVLQLGLMCTYRDPRVRPTMRQVVKALERGNDERQVDAWDVDLVVSGEGNGSSSSGGVWSGYQHGLYGAELPTLDHVLQSFPSSVSLLTSDVIVEGR
ncbi:unnamed protein product [Linum tenue]|uniref:non-specific serine/threonine protein kinase n=2 Tax=Linum tenue TaxID=586396 RepID=A0AAV0QWT8_9ROSI|nr:unnamed protein product [Linum tenue]